MKRTRLDPVDHAWFRMDRPHNPMMVTGVLTFDEPVDMPRLVRTVEERIAPFRRFRQRVVPRRLGRRAVWEDVPNFRIENHIEHRTLPQPADHHTLRREIGRLVSTPLLPSDDPLWHLHVLENPNDGRTVLVVRLHHCLADGFALMEVMLTLTDDAPNSEVRPASAFEAEATASWEGRRPTRAARRRSRLRTIEALRTAAMLGSTLIRLATLGSQPRTTLRGPVGRDKYAAWSEPIPLERVKVIGRAQGGTVNDVLMTAAAGALARYLRERGEDLRGFGLRAAVPINLRRSVPRELGNYFGLVFLELPLGLEDPRERFLELKRRMDALKRSPEPFVLLQVLRLAGSGPRWLEDVVVRYLGAKTTGVLTNVPGPREPRYLAGGRIRTIMFWVPQAGRVGLGISIFSYAGEVRLGLTVDALLVRDPERILDNFPAELDALQEAPASESAASP